jgi:hypothetical protein
MTNRSWLVTGPAGLVFFLASAAGSAQEPAHRGVKPSAGAKNVASFLDSKGLQDRKAAAEAAAFLESAYKGERPPEGVRMLVAILRGSRMGPGEGWFGPADSRYSWKWLVSRYGADPDKGGIPRSRFRGPEAWFARLDRNQDGVITPDDLDWSDRNPYVQMSYLANRLFRQLNAQGNGHLTKEELLQFFEKASRGKDHLSPDDFREALLAGMFGGSRPGDAPKPAVLIRGLFAGELGSMNEGPRINEPAPDFTLKTVDGKETVHFGMRIGPKPVVLVFGSFT